MQHGPSRARSQDPLREDFFRLFLRSYHAAQKQGRGLEVYRASAKFAFRLLAEPWARQTIFPAELALVRRFLAETGLPGDPDTVAQLNLMANPWAASLRKR